MSEQEMKRQRAIDLLCAQIKVSLATVYNIRKAMEGMDPIQEAWDWGHNKNE
ncbi:Hypothetical protein FKW44_004825, partial [Caligus rogercresseyi]